MSHSTTTRSTPRHTRKPQLPQPAWPDAGGATAAVPCVGVVTEAADGSLRVRSGSIEATGRRAASCLLEPAAGDTVACLRVAPDEVWVLAILEREPGRTDVLSTGRPLRVAAPELTLDSARFALQAGQAEVTVDEAKVSGRQFLLVGSAIKLIGSALSSVFDRVTHYSKHHLRHTEGIDRLQATHVECDAQQTLRLSGEHTLINGDKLVKARGSQIHFG